MAGLRGIQWEGLLRMTQRAGARVYTTTVQPRRAPRRFALAPPPRRVNSTHAAVATSSPRRPDRSPWSKSRAGRITQGIVVAAGVAFVLLQASGPAIAEEPAQDEARLIRLAEVSEHGRSAETFWVYRGDRVYDITEWVPNHPGGDVILRAAGGSIDPYWKIFTIHQTQDVLDILEQFFIGKIDPQDLVDGQAPASEIDDPFKSDPERDSSLIVRSAKPCNAETPASELNAYITPNDKFYVRNHLWVPEVESADQHRLTITLPDGEEVEYTVADLRNKFPKHTITATLQCSGNRRAHMSAASRPTSGLPWDVGGIGTATWTGVKLRDVLVHAGVNVQEPDEDIRHAQFVGAEAYGASIPFDKAIDRRGDVLLAYDMNGQPLPRDHGYPLRVLVPGTVAARSVKWLNKIILSSDESTSQWQQRDYKCFGPNVTADKVDWNDAPAIQETPVQSAITAVREVKAEQLKDSDLARAYKLDKESVVLEGYAYAGGGRDIVRVDVSPDKGKTWWQAQLLAPPEQASKDDQKSWAWKQWRLALPRDVVKEEFCVKAVDDAYNTQPEGFDPYWNFRGNLANSWHRVKYSPSGKKS